MIVEGQRLVANNSGKTGEEVAAFGRSPRWGAHEEWDGPGEKKVDIDGDSDGSRVRTARQVRVRRSRKAEDKNGSEEDGKAAC